MIRDGKHKFDEQDEANCQRQAEQAMRVLPQLEYRARFTAAEAPWSDKRLLFVSVVLPQRCLDKTSLFLLTHFPC